MLEAAITVLSVLALLLLLAAGALALLRLEFLAHAARARGLVVSLRPAAAAASHADAQPLTPIVRFAAGKDQDVEFVGGPAASPPRYRIGDAVPVRYRPNDPAGSARIESFRGLWLAPALLAAFAVPVALVAAGLLLWRAADAQDAAELRRSGARISGVVTRIDLAGPAGADPPRFVLIVEAEAPAGGRRLVLESEPVEAATRKAYAIGDRVPVLIDPADPARYRIELR